MPLLFPTVTGRPLADGLGREPGNHTELLHITELAMAVATLHAQGVYLGMIDPNSVVVQTNGRVGFTSWPSLSASINMNAAAFRAPEMSRGIEAHARADVYSLGMILRKALTGSTSSAKTAHSAGLQAIVDQATAAAPAGRFADAREFYYALHDALRTADEHADARIGPARDIADRMRTDLVSIHKRVRKAKRAEDHSRAVALEGEAARVSLQLEGVMKTTLAMAPGDPPSQATMADLHRLTAIAAEKVRDTQALEKALTELQLHDRGAHSDFVRGDGYFSLTTEPPDAAVTLYKMREDGRGATAEPYSSKRLPLERERLPSGAWEARVSRDGYKDTVYSFHLGRGRHFAHPQTPEDEPLKLLPYSAIEQGEAYVPAGPAILGGDVNAPAAGPRHAAWVPGFLMQTRPVSHNDYLVFLNELVNQRRHDEVDQYMPIRHVECRQEPIYIRGFAGKVELPPRSNSEMVGPHAPVVLVNIDAVKAYALWFSVRARRRWKLPSEAQWEKAARGGDGRWYPWGDFLDPKAVQTTTTGIDAFPDVRQPGRDMSPYGIGMMGGSVREWTCTPWAIAARTNLFTPIRQVTEEFVVKGSSFLESAAYARAAARGRAWGAQGFYDIGFRLIHELD